MERTTLYGFVMVVLLVLLGIALWFTLAGASEPEPVLRAAPAAAPKPVAPPPAPEPDEPSQQKIYRLPPAGEDPPDPVPPAAAGALLPDETRAFQTAGMDAVGRAKSECLRPWAEQQGVRVEVVMDTVLHDGVVADIQLRTLTELPQHVLDCVRDEAWAIDWPEAEAPGEVRFQHTLDVGQDLR